MGLNASQVSAVLVTRGDVDLTPVLDSLPFDDVVIWNNSTRPEDLKVAGRYAAIAEAKHELIYTQDDDAICPAAELVERYAGYLSWKEAGPLLVNVPPGEQPWLAWGAVFHRDQPDDAFKRWGALHDFDDETFCRWADVVFAHLAGWREVDLGHDDLPWATAPNRMYQQPDHYTGQQRVRERAQALL